ncbi:hypothetical protein I4U23_007299 [Adineta vaga]|nr:hypothetical protein I4U23_007299 [Adineta vaga]
MSKYMRSIYDATISQKRNKRHINSFPSSLILSNELDSIISIPNQGNNHSTDYYFNYNSSLENLMHIELILPIRQITNSSTIHIKFNQSNLFLTQPFRFEKNCLKINLTQYIHSFPVRFHLYFYEISLQSSTPFLTLHYHRLFPSKSRHRRDIISSSNDELITHPNDPSACQVRSFRTSFADLNWTSWIIEPSSYEMNICSGKCQTNSNMSSYFQMQSLLHRIHPNKLPIVCCKPKRFSSTILLYYDGLNLILKRHENMRVVECGCS